MDLKASGLAEGDAGDQGNRHYPADGNFMKLNPDILFDELSKHIVLERVGSGPEQLTLGRPIFFEPSQALLPDKVYVACREFLPAIPPSITSQLVICLGGNPPAAWQKIRTSLFVIHEQRDPLQVFNLLQGIYDRFDQWEAELNQILEQDADFGAMVQCSARIFGKRIVLTDKNLNILALTAPLADFRGRLVKDGDMIGPEDIAKVRSIYNEYRKRTEPFLHDDGKLYAGGELIYSINLFVSDHYEGCASLFADPDPFRAEDFALFQVFAGFVQKGLHKQIKILNKQTVSTRMVIKDLLDGSPVSESRVYDALKPGMANNPNSSDHWICLKFRSAKTSHSLPVDYLCAALEARLPGCIAMLYDGEIVSIVPLASGQGEQQTLNEIVDPFLRGMDFQIGVSAVFVDLRTVRTYYRQACCALEAGVPLQPGEIIYRFSDYALPYMLASCKGEFAPEDLLDAGLSALRQHDRDSAVSYWQTLRSYVDNERNVAQTARVLFIHRSTLQQRLAHIFEIMGGEPASPEEWMRIRLSLYMLDHPSP